MGKYLGSYGFLLLKFEEMSFNYPSEKEYSDEDEGLNVR